MCVLADGTKLALSGRHEIFAQGPFVVGVELSKVLLYIPNLCLAVGKGAAVHELAAATLDELLTEHCLVLWTAHLSRSSVHIGRPQL